MGLLRDPVSVSKKVYPHVKAGARVEVAVDDLIQRGVLDPEVRDWVDVENQQIDFPCGPLDNPPTDLYRSFYQAADGDWYLSDPHAPGVRPDPLPKPIDRDKYPSPT